MSKRMLTAIEAIAKGQKCTIPPMKFSEFEGFMRAIKSAQKKLAMQ